MNEVSQIQKILHFIQNIYSFFKQKKSLIENIKILLYTDDTYSINILKIINYIQTNH